MLDSTPKPIIPPFLKVLCILTFIGSGYNIFGSISNALSGSQDTNKILISEAFEEVADELREDLPEESLYIIEEAEVFMTAFIDNIQNYSAASFIMYAISLIGAFLMYKLKLTGFYLYTAAQIGFVAIIILFFPINLIGGIYLATTFFLSAIWVIMYSTQIKYLR